VSEANSANFAIVAASHDAALFFLFDGAMSDANSAIVGEGGTAFMGADATSSDLGYILAWWRWDAAAFWPFLFLILGRW